VIPEVCLGRLSSSSSREAGGIEVAFFALCPPRCRSVPDDMAVSFEVRTGIMQLRWEKGHLKAQGDASIDRGKLFSENSKALTGLLNHDLP